MIKTKVFAFIDSQNLNLGVKSQGWNLDFARFRVYLIREYSHYVVNIDLLKGKLQRRKK